MDADERSVLKYQRLKREGKRVSARDARIACFVGLANETGFPHEGMIDFVDNRIDPMTGTIVGRAVLPNPDGFLLPGFFARARIPGSGRYQTMLVPDSAVVTDQTQKLLLIVGPDNIVQPRPVKLGALFGELRAIESGIGPNDRVVIVGLMQARPGIKVNPHESTFPVEAIPLMTPDSPTTQAQPAPLRSPP